MKWTPEVALALGAAFKRGTSIGDVARRAGVGKSTLHRWHRAALAGDTRFAPLVPLFKEMQARWLFSPW
jgi:transposase-like protein